ncbi:MAG: hypothetical protein P8Y44_06160, partial [Acidobacteriota bacterium]
HALLAATSALTLGLTLLWLVEPGWSYNLAHGRSHLLDILAIRTDTDVARFFASSTRLRAATWIWPPAAFLLTTTLWWTRLSQRSVAVVYGLCGCLFLTALLPFAARTRATRVVELEDPWIHKHSGRLYPEIWVVYRPRFRGGWLLTGKQSLTIPLVAAGDTFDLTLDFRDRWDLPLAGTLELSGEDGEILADRDIRGLNHWQQVSFTDLERPSGDRLTIGLIPPDQAQTHAILDRGRLQWH